MLNTQYLEKPSLFWTYGAPAATTLLVTMGVAALLFGRRRSALLPTALLGLHIWFDGKRPTVRAKAMRKGLRREETQLLTYFPHGRINWRGRAAKAKRLAQLFIPTASIRGNEARLIHEGEPTEIQFV